MSSKGRRIVTGHDESGKSIILSDGPPPQTHAMTGPGVGADFVEMWNVPDAVPSLAAMPPSGHLLRLIELYPASMGGHRTVMHRTRTLDYVVVIEGEVTLLLDDSEVVLAPGDVVVQRGTNHAWENRSDSIARCAFFHIDATFDDAMLETLPKPLELMT
jgi:mannose-6-phosphate isomerase-like protein (cupin superfamily)